MICNNETHVPKMEQLEFEIVLTLLKEKKSHVRGIAQNIGASPSKVSRTLKEMVKKNIVDFETEGKNKVFGLKKGIESASYAYMAEHYKLFKVFQKYPEMAVICEDILKKTDEKLVVLFGSYAKFRANKGSDIDVYIETENRSVKNKVENINSKLSVKIGSFDASSFLAKEIIKYHVILRGVEYFYEKNKLLD